MPDASDLRERIRRAADVSIPPVDLEPVERRARALRRRRAAVAAIVTVVVAAGVALPLSGLRDIGERANVRSTGETVRPIGFQPAPGWAMAMTDPPSEPGGQVVYVTNRPFAPIDLDGSSVVDGMVVLPVGAERTLRTLPDEGILITASVVYRSRNPLPPHQDFTARPLPWRLPAGPPETSWEGSSEGLSRYALGGSTGGRFVVVNVYFGSEAPGPDVVARAQEELDRLVVDPAPPPTEQLNGFGLAIDPPDDWDGRLYAWASSPPILELSTISLDRHTPGNPMVPNRDLLTTAGDASIVLAESDVMEGHASSRTPIAIGVDDRCDGCEVLDDGTLPPRGHALFHQAFENGGRSFDLYVEFGSEPGAADLARVNEMLAGFVIQPAPGVEPQPLLALPSGWVQMEDPLPALIRPRIVVAAGSFRFPAQPLIACGPQPALEAMPPDGAFVWIVRYAGDFPGTEAWPERFTLDLPSRPGDVECAGGTDGTVRQYFFAGPERLHYQVLVALGTEADAATRHEVEQVVSSFSP